MQKNHPKFDDLMARCHPQPTIEPFFHRVARSPYATRLAQENSLAVFRRWNYWCQELRYLSGPKEIILQLKVDAGS